MCGICAGGVHGDGAPVIYRAASITHRNVAASAGEALTAAQQAAQTASGGIAPRADGLVPMRSGLAATCRNGDGASKQVPTDACSLGGTCCVVPCAGGPRFDS